MNDFEKQAMYIHEKRAIERIKKAKEDEKNGKPIYVEYCVWCNAFCNGEGQKNPKQFGAWIRQEGISLTEHQRRWIGETYFGYKFSWNGKTWVKEK